MASVLREGGTHPIEIKTWQDCVKVAVLECLYDSSPHWGDLWHRIQHRYLDPGRVRERFHHLPIELELKDILKDMYAEGLIEVLEYKCECCKTHGICRDKILEHAVRFKLTDKGYDRVPEHIFP